MLAVTDKTRCDVFGFFMSSLCTDCYHYISAEFTLAGMKWAEFGETQGRIADSDNIWWLNLVHCVRDIAKTNTQLVQLLVAKPFLETQDILPVL
jgi:hypothetical protein